jgi:hypothetical protein
MVVAGWTAGDYEDLSMIQPVKLMSVVLQNCTGQVRAPLQLDAVVQSWKGSVGKQIGSSQIAREHSFAMVGATACQLWRSCLNNW